MKGLALIRHSDKTAYIFKKRFEQKGVELEVMEMKALHNGLVSGKIKQPLTKQWDFVLLLYPKKYDFWGVFEVLKNDGIRVFNTPSAVEKCDDKWLCYQALKEAEIPQMATYETWEQAKEAGLLEKDEDGKLLKKVVVKDRYGSFGEKVHLASYYKDLKQVVNDLTEQGVPFVVQEFCETTNRKGARVTCIGGKYVASYYKRTTDGDFVVNLHNNAIGRKWEIPAEFVAVAEKTAQTIGADYCGIDFMFGKNDDEPIVCEVNARAVFSAMEEINEIDIKGLYVDYILEQMGVKANEEA